MNRYLQVIYKLKGSEVMNDFQVIGYYICSVEDTPQFLNGISDKIISVSSCISYQNPRWECLVGGWLIGEEESYREKYKMSSEDYNAMVKEIRYLFNCGRMDTDSRFLYKEDAGNIFDKYFCGKDAMLICLSMEQKYIELLKNEFSGSNRRITEIKDESELAGYDIIGWDMDGFHSFLCNNLQSGFDEIKFNKIGLLENDYFEVDNIARKIEGLGEPVEWLPCKIGKV